MFDQDPQRVCILQGPVAVKHSTVANEPIKDLLGSIEAGLTKKLLHRYYGGDESKVPVIEYLGGSNSSSTNDLISQFGISASSSSSRTTYKIAQSVPPTLDWLEELAGPTKGWLRAALTSSSIVHGNGYLDNPLIRILAPREGQTVVVDKKDGLPTCVTFFGAARSFGKHKSDFKAAELGYDSSSRTISLTLFEDRTNSSVPLHLSYKYCPEMGGQALIHEVTQGRNDRIKQFYWKLWFGDNETMPTIDIHDTFSGPQVTITAEHIERFCSVVGNQSAQFKTARSAEVQAPMDFAIVTGWQVCRSKHTAQSGPILTFAL